MNKKFQRLFTLLLILCLILQPFGVSSVKAAGTTTVYGADGTTTYDIPSDYVKQLNINSGAITITDTGYTQGSNSESWDASTDAYVIKGTGTSTNNITISTTNYKVTVYLLDLSWNGSVVLPTGSKANIVVVGTVKTNSTYFLTRTTYSYLDYNDITISGFNEDSILNGVYLGNFDPSGNYIYFEAKNLTINLNSYIVDDYYPVNTSIVNCHIVTLGTINMLSSQGAQYGYGLNGTMDITGSTIDRLYINPCDNNPLINITDSKIGSFYITSAKTSGAGALLNIADSTVDLFKWMYYYTTSNLTQQYVRPLSITNSVISSMTGVNSTYYPYTFEEIAATDSTISFPANGFYNNLSLSSLKLDYSSFDYSIKNNVLGLTPINSNNDDLFLKIVRLRDNPDTYILVKYEDGHTSKLLSDSNGYLYLYIPAGSKTLEFQVTDETGTGNYGNYILDFEPISSDDTTVSEPEAMVQPTLVTTPYINTDMEYLFDGTTWVPETTDNTGSFSVVIPEGANRIYIRLVPSSGTKYAEITDGSIGIWQDAKPIILSQSASPTVFVKGKEEVLYVEAKPFTEGNTLTYQWKKDGANISGGTTAILTIPVAEETDAGIYTCTVTESDGKENATTPITVTVTDTADNAELQEQINTLQGQITELQEQLATANEDKGDLEDSIADLQAQIEDLQNQINALQQQVSNLEDELAQAGNDNSDLNALIITLNEQITTLNQNKETLETQLEQANNENAELFETVTNLSLQVDTLTNQLTNLNDQLADMEEENTDLKAQVIALQNELTILHTNIEGLNQNISTLTDTNTVLQEQLDTVNETIITLNTILNEIKTELGVTDNEDILAAILALKQQLQDTLNENTTLMNQIQDLEEQLSEATAGNDALYEKLEELIQLVGAEDSDDLFDKIVELQTTIQNSNTQITSLEQQKADLEEQLQEALATIVQLQAQLEALLNSGDATEDELRNQIADLTEQITQLQSENNSLIVSVTNLNTQITNLNSEKVELESEIARLESLLESANSTIEELRQQLADLTAEYTKLLSDNHSLTEEKEALQTENNNLKEELEHGGNTEGDVQELQNQLEEANQEIDNLNKELEEAKSNQSSHTSSPAPDTTLPEDAVVITPAKENVVSSIVDNTVTNPVTGGQLVAEPDWEIAKSPTDEFTSELALNLDSYVGIFSFYDNDLNHDTNNLSLNNPAIPVQSLSLTSNIGTSVKTKLTDQLVTDADGYVKYTFYARKKLLPEQIYECSVDVKAMDYLSPVTSLISTNPEITNNYSEANTYEVEVKNGFTLTVDANFGTYGREAILYQLVPADTDFDPDGAWKVVEGNTIQIKKVTEPERLYIKYIDKGNNYTVDKTVGFKPETLTEQGETATEPILTPTFTMNKTIYLGYQYKYQFSNITKGDKITYQSSDSEVAAVDKSGVITAVKKGKAVISCAITKGNSRYQYSLHITVADGEGSPTLNLISPDITSTGNTPVLLLYKQLKKNAQTKLVLDGITEDALITYITSDDKVVTVTKDGTLTGKKKGSAEIAALITQNGKQYIYLIKVRVDDGTKDEDMYEYLE